jgi:hypothetical protein
MPLTRVVALAGAEASAKRRSIVSAASERPDVPPALRVRTRIAAACTLYGLPYEQLAGCALGTLAHGDALAGLQIRAVVETGRPRRFQVTHYRADASELPVDIEASLIDYDGGKLVLCMHRMASEGTTAARHIMTTALEWQLTVDSMETVVLLSRVFKPFFTRRAGGTGLGPGDRRTHRADPRRPRDRRERRRRWRRRHGAAPVFRRLTVRSGIPALHRPEIGVYVREFFRT